MSPTHGCRCNWSPIGAGIEALGAVVFTGVVLATAILACPSGLGAQVRVGVLAGFGGASLADVDPGSPFAKPLNGPVLGLDVGLRLSRALEIGPEMLLLRKRTLTRNGLYETAHWTGNANADVVDLPVLLRGTYGPTAVRIMFGAGAGVEWARSCHLARANGTSSDSTCDSIDYLELNRRRPVPELVGQAGLRWKRYAMLLQVDYGMGSLGGMDSPTGPADRDRTFMLLGEISFGGGSSRR
jgi:hypothetical protein